MKTPQLLLPQFASSTGLETSVHAQCRKCETRINFRVCSHAYISTYIKVYCANCGNYLFNVWTPLESDMNEIFETLKQSKVVIPAPFELRKKIQSELIKLTNTPKS